MDGMLGFVFAFVVPLAMASVCWKSDSCYYPDTKPLGVPFLEISTKDISPMSCVRVCSLTEDCVGVTLDPLEGMCRLYGEISSFGITTDLGTGTWLFQAAGVPCIRVRKIPMNRISQIYTSGCVFLVLCRVCVINSYNFPAPVMKPWMMGIKSTNLIQNK